MRDVEKKRNVFITGSAGSGKSYILKECFQKLKEEGRVVKMCATTSIAASLVNGCTLHSFAGIGIGEKDENKERKVFAFEKNRAIEKI